MREGLPCAVCGLRECVCERIERGEKVEDGEAREVTLGKARFKVRPAFQGIQLLERHGLMPKLAEAQGYRSMQSAYRAWSDHVAVLGAGGFQLAQVAHLSKGGAPEDAVFPYALELYLRACFETAFSVSQDGVDSGVDCFVFEELERLGVDGARLWKDSEAGRVRAKPLHAPDCEKPETNRCTCDARLLVVRTHAVPVDRWEAFRAWEARRSS